jgi:uncharacterized protein (TIGR02118 family)
MIKVMWFLKRAERLSLEEFHRWWLDRHAPMVVQAQRPHLKRYVINLRWEQDTLPGKPTGESEWDGCAELWFETEADFSKVYGGSALGPTRADTLNHVSRFERLIVHEHKIDVT